MRLKPNAVEFRGDVAYIKLTQGKHAVVDVADYPLVAVHRWYAHKERRQYYAHTMIRTPDGKRAVLRMHRLLLPHAVEVDHADHDGLDNRRGNLRECTHAQNLANGRKHNDCSSRFKGVSWNKAHQKWEAQITVSGVQACLGYFTSQIEAAHAYDDAARGHFGEFACLNFPERVAGTEATP